MEPSADGARVGMDALVVESAAHRVTRLLLPEEATRINGVAMRRPDRRADSHTFR